MEKDSQGFARLWERQDFGRGFARICETLGQDLQGFVRLWKKIRDSKTLGEDLSDFGRGLARITEDLQGFVRLWERICKIS